MALASLILSFFSLIAPFGIAAVVLAHISRGQIAKSRGRLRGTWHAFAALILGYLQLVVVLLLAIAAGAFLLKFNQELNRNHWARAALVERLKYGDPHKVTASDEAMHQQNALQALHLIRGRQREYLAAHPDEGFACRLDQLGYQPTEESELRTFILNSRYDLKIYNCRAPYESRYVVLAVPRSDFNLPDSPVYCLDSSQIMRKYNTEQSPDAIARVAGKDRELCPQDGELVE